MSLTIDKRLAQDSTVVYNIFLSFSINIDIKLYTNHKGHRNNNNNLHSCNNLLFEKPTTMHARLYVRIYYLVTWSYKNKQKKRRKKSEAFESQIHLR